MGELFAALADGMKAVLAPVDHDTARHVLAALVDVVECFARAPGRKAEDGAETAMWETMGQAAQQVDRGLHLRVILLRAQARLPAPDTDQAAPAATSDQALNLANDGLIATRRLDQLDRGIGASAPYFHYRSLLLLTRGTARWAGRDDADKFRKAYQDYERARGTIEPAPDRTLAAQIDLHATACALAHGDWYLREDEHGVADGPLLSRSNAKYLIAKGYLRRAFDHLLNARRNVVWWGEYFRLNAKYKSRRNLWRITRLAARLGPDPAKALDWVKQQNVISRFSVTLRQALVSVRHGRDLELTPQPDPWYRHALDEMHRAYTWFVVNTFLLPWEEASTDPNRSPKLGRGADPWAPLRAGAKRLRQRQEALERGAKYWEWLLKSVGIGEWGHPASRYEPPDRQAWRSARELRHRLIYDPS